MKEESFDYEQLMAELRIKVYDPFHGKEKKATLDYNPKQFEQEELLGESTFKGFYPVIQTDTIKYLKLMISKIDELSRQNTIEHEKMENKLEHSLIKTRFIVDFLHLIRRYPVETVKHSGLVMFYE